MKKDFEYLENESCIELSDLALVSALYFLKFPIVAFNRNPKEYPKVGFIFKRNKKIESTINSFWDGSLSVEPKGYWNAIRDLKSRIRTDNQ